MAAITAGLVFWGYGFDQARDNVLRVWWGFSLVTAVMIILNQQKYWLNLTTVTVCMCHLVSSGGLLYCGAWMMYHCDGSPLATASAFYTLYGASLLLTTFVMSFFTNLMLMVVLLVVLLLATAVLNQSGLP